MKLSIILAFLAIITAISCSRSTLEPENGYPLHGKWKFKEYYVDPGNGSGTWQPAPQGQTYIDFNINGTLATDVGLFSGYSKYESTDSTVTIMNISGTNQFFMYYNIEGNVLTLNPLCFEGCSYKFKRW